MTVAAQIVHAVPGRMRVRVSAMRGDAGYFERAAAHLARLDGVLQAQTNVRTGSLLLIHSGVSAQAVGEWAERESLFTLAGEAQAARAATVWEVASSGIGSVDEGLKAASSGFLDVRSVVFVGLLAMALRQATKGTFLGPAVPLFWYALQLLNTSWKGDGG